MKGKSYIVLEHFLHGLQLSIHYLWELFYWSNCESLFGNIFLFFFFGQTYFSLLWNTKLFSEEPNMQFFYSSPPLTTTKKNVMPINRLLISSLVLQVNSDQFSYFSQMFYFLVDEPIQFWVAKMRTIHLHCSTSLELRAIITVVGGFYHLSFIMDLWKCFLGISL